MWLTIIQSSVNIKGNNELPFFSLGFNLRSSSVMSRSFCAFDVSKTFSFMQSRGCEKKKKRFSEWSKRTFMSCHVSQIHYDEGI